ncbi:hypothetical protein N5F23_15380, partial [Pseudomonas sichuanensis]|uniref:hypothetical protein n=1 Tax=Pseudomonas sichuanensis TaxID=2213015 RepID=UPI00244BF3D8
LSRHKAAPTRGQRFHNGRWMGQEKRAFFTNLLFSSVFFEKKASHLQTTLVKCRPFPSSNQLNGE